MLLKDKYYKLMRENRLDANTAVFLVSLLPQADVYRGHFPQRPVCPGACTIQMMRECAELLTGNRLLIRTIKQCRFITMATPQHCSLLDVTVQVARIEGTDAYNVTARMTDADATYAELKGEFCIDR